MVGQLKGLCTQFPFGCPLTLTGVPSLHNFGYMEVTSVCSGEHCGHWCILEVGNVAVAPLPNWFGYSIPFEVWIVLIVTHHNRRLRKIWRTGAL